MTERYVIREQATGRWYGRFGSHEAACTWGDRYMGHPDWCVYTERGARECGIVLRPMRGQGARIVAEAQS
jgi:hypothetical protein